ncbi:MAG: enoyl-CoA hydratase/isomerase family protein [Burkholderiaceae bacterium]|nr:enoyl-CoA hydratase/isomerase family protein [Burkholderiaceae bacterium]
MSYQTLQTEYAQGIALIWMNRPKMRNALDNVVIAELTDAFSAAIEDDGVRAIVLAGRGKAFCAGADLNWLKTAREMTPDEAREDSIGLARLMRLIYESPKPTVARVQGAAYAGGMGLVAACDITVAAHEAKFCLSEVKLGLIASMIGPYVIKAMGEARARRFFLTAEAFDAAEAYRIGFVHELAPAEELDATVNRLLGHLVMASPNAMAETKQLIRDVVGRPIDDELTHDTATRLARVRASDDAQEGISAFFEKRKPRWVPEPPAKPDDDDDEADE